MYPKIENTFCVIIVIVDLICMIRIKVDIFSRSICKSARARNKKETLASYLDVTKRNYILINFSFRTPFYNLQLIFSPLLCQIVSDFFLSFPFLVFFISNLVCSMKKCTRLFTILAKVKIQLKRY